MIVEVGPEIEQLVFEVCRRPEPSVIQMLVSNGGTVKNLKRVEIALLAAFHRLSSNGLLRLRNSIYNFAFTGL
jgi:hypothetical protein